MSDIKDKAKDILIESEQKTEGYKELFAEKIGHGDLYRSAKKNRKYRKIASLIDMIIIITILMIMLYVTKVI